MYLKNLFLRNFRNYSEQRIDFHNQVNFLVGKNAQGKTNIVESIGFLSTGRSFRRHRDEDILRLGEDFFYLAGSVIRGIGNYLLSAL